MGVLRVSVWKWSARFRLWIQPVAATH